VLLPGQARKSPEISPPPSSLDGGRGPRFCLGIRFRRTQPRIYIAGECPGLRPGVHFRRTRPWIQATGEWRAEGSSLDLSAFLPAAQDLQIWEPKAPLQHFKGDDLFLYIDGGAEIYREYGFKQVVVQDYQDKKGRSITLEIFEMDGPESAYGMFTFKSTAKGRPYGIGQEARLEDYYLNFWKGPCLVTLTGFDAGGECVQGLLQIARAVNAKMPLKGNRPALMDILPKEWAAPSRLIYFRGLLALNNIHVFFPQDVFRFKEGLAAEQDKFKIVIFRYESPAEARKRFQTVYAAFADSPAYKDVKRPMENYFEATDERGRRVNVQTYDDLIILNLTPTAADRGVTAAIF